MIKEINAVIFNETRRDTRFSRLNHADWRGAIVFLVLLASAVAGIQSSWTALSPTYDEPYHIANGLAWLGRGTQDDFEQPPLAQGVAALGLYLKGIRVAPAKRPVREDVRAIQQ